MINDNLFFFELYAFLSHKLLLFYFFFFLTAGKIFTLVVRYYANFLLATFVNFPFSFAIVVYKT